MDFPFHERWLRMARNIQVKSSSPPCNSSKITVSYRSFQSNRGMEDVLIWTFVTEKEGEILL